MCGGGGGGVGRRGERGDPEARTQENHKQHHDTMDPDRH